MPNSKKPQKEQPKPIVHCRQMRIDDKGTTTSGDDTSIEDIKVKKAECFCNRDFAVDEIKCIVQQLRGSKTIEPLFDAKNCDLPASDKTYERFTEELNKVCTKYEINTCIRKIHFLAQIAVEAALFHTTEEYGGSKARYAPFYGRGLKQITWDYNYLAYHDYKNGTNYYKDFKKILNEGKLKEKLKKLKIKDMQLHYALDEKPNDSLTSKLYEELIIFAESIGKSLELSWDTAGWFWQKSEISIFADQDSIFDVSKLVNNPSANEAKYIVGFDQREKNYNKLKEALEYATCKNH